MGFGKKKRGQQRKTAKQQTATTVAAPTAAINDLNQLVVYTHNRQTYVHPDHHELVAAYFQRADHKATTILAYLTSEDVPTHGICWPNISLGREILWTLLYSFLDNCEDNTFEKVVADSRALGSVSVPSGAVISITGGWDLHSPSLWIKVLCRAAELEPTCQVEIANSINPLVRCMGNDTDRLFFKSTDHWKEGVEASVCLVYNMIINSTDDDLRRKVITAFLSYEDFIPTFVKIGFWKDQRPDIVEVLGVEKCIQIAAFGRSIVGKIVIYAANNLCPENRRLLSVIGCMPIVSKQYNPKCMISYTAGLMTRWMQEEESEEEFFLSKEGWRWKDSLKHDILNILPPLVEEAYCIDNDVIKGMISLGMNHVHDYACAVVVARLSENMLWKEDIHRPSDTRAALAIRSGLVEMCLNFVERFGSVGLVDVNAPNVLHQHIEQIFRHVHATVLHQKTPKAIRHQQRSIKKGLAQIQQNTSNTNNIKCTELFDMIRSILDLSGLYCCWCNKSLSKTDVLECNGCHRMSYCSRTCQKKDWQNGQNLACCTSFTPKIISQFQGRLVPESVPENERAVVKLKDLETNLNMIQLKLFLYHAETVLTQASTSDIPLWDCIVWFDLRHCPHRVETKSYTEFYKTPEELMEFEKRSKENITCIYASPFYVGESEHELAMQRFFPHEWLSKQSGQCAS